MKKIQESNKHPIDTRRLFETVIWSAPARPGGTLVRKRLLSLSNNRMSPPSKVRCCWQWKISSGHQAATPGAAQTALMLLTPQREQIWRHCTRFRGNVIWSFKSQLGLVLGLTGCLDWCLDWLLGLVLQFEIAALVSFQSWSASQFCDRCTKWLLNLRYKKIRIRKKMWNHRTCF